MTLPRDLVEAMLGVTRPPYAWTIDSYPVTEDFQAEPTGTVTQGPSGAPDELLARLAQGEGQTFRLLDDDGVVYFIGRILVPGEEGESLGDMHFTPLWDLGEGYGCVEIQYEATSKLTGKFWETL